MATRSKEKAKKPEAPKFTKKELLAEATTAFGVNHEMLAGALHGVEAPITVAEANKLLEAFKNKGVTN